MSNLEIILLGILIVSVINMVILGTHLSTIEDRLQNISSHIFWLKEEDDE